MKDMGYDWESVHSRWPRLVMCSVSGFGQTGPATTRPAMDVVIQAMSGIMSMTGFKDREPVGAGCAMADSTAGTYGSIGILAALWDRQRTNEGAYVDIGMLDCMAAMMAPLTVRTMNNARGFADGKQPEREGSSARSGAPFDTYSAKDGYIAIIGKTGLHRNHS